MLRDLPITDFLFLQTCAAACLQERTCQAFVITFQPPTCSLYQAADTQELNANVNARYFVKNLALVSSLMFRSWLHAFKCTSVSAPYQSHKLYYSFAEVPADIQNGGEAFFVSGNETGVIPLQINSDEIPELNERFEVELTGVEVKLAPGEKLIASNAPTLGIRRWVVKRIWHANYLLP